MAYYGGGGPAPAGGMAYVQPPKVRFDAIGEAWSLFREQMGAWIVATLIVFVIMAVPIGAMYTVLFGSMLASARGGGGGQIDPSMNLSVQLMANGMSIAVAAIMAFFLGGLYKMAIKQVRGEVISAGDVFSAGDVALPLIGASILIGIGTQIGAMLCIIPGLILAGLWMLTLPLIVDKKMGVIEAMSASFNALKSDMLTATLFYLVLSLVAAIGALLCGVGALFTYPLFPLAIAIVYRDFFLGGNTGGPTLNMPLPPQSAYGSQPGGYPPPPSTPGGYPPPPPPPPPGGTANPGGMQTLGGNEPPPPPPPPPGGGMPSL